MPKIELSGKSTALSILLACWCVAAFGQENDRIFAPGSEDRPSTHEHVRQMLSLAEVGSGDVVWDLGSGDGRIAISAVRDFGARRAVGVEIKPEMVKKSREAAVAAGVAERVEFIEEDMFQIDFSQATVLTLYVGHEANIRLRPKIIKTLKPGTRIVSNNFSMGEWVPDKKLSIRKDPLGMFGTFVSDFTDFPGVPEFQGYGGFGTTNQIISLWRVPAPIAGVWRGKYDQDGQEHELTFHLIQRLGHISKASDTFAELTGVHALGVSLYGVDMEFLLPSETGNIFFKGRVEERQVTGELEFRNKTDKAAFTREDASIAGAWELPCKDTEKPFLVTIEEVDGVRVASCSHEDFGGPWPLVDFYEFGSGFYFTLKLHIGDSRWSTSGGGDYVWLTGAGSAGKLERGGSSSIHWGIWGPQRGQEIPGIIVKEGNKPLRPQL